MLATDAAALARVLYQARLDRTPIPPLTDADPSLGIAEGYAIQNEVVARLVADGDRVIGYKVGLTSTVAQRMFGADAPGYGPVLASTVYGSGDDVPLERFIQPKLEAEVGLLMGERLAGPGVTVSEARRAIRGAVAALEIADSRIENWRIKLADTLADLASSAAVVASSRVVPIEGLDTRLIGMTLTRDGEPVGAGTSAAALGDPVAVVAWLADALGQAGGGLEPGNLVMTGALHAPVAMDTGVYSAEFDQLGPLTIKVVS